MVLLLFSSFLFVGDGFLTALAGTCVVLGGLTAHGKTVTVTDTAIASYVHETLDVQLDFAAQVAFYFVIAAYHFADFCGLFVAPVFYFDVDIYAGFSKMLLAELRPMPKM